MSAAFLVTTLIVIVIPGAGVLYTLSIGVSRGRRASVAAAFGCTLGIVPHMAAAMSGLAAVLQASPVAFGVMQYAGVAYLGYLAVKTLREKERFAVREHGEDASAGRVIVSAVLVNLLNPKLAIFFLAFLPQFVHPGGGDWFTRMLALSAVFMLATFVVFVGYGIFAGWVRDYLASRPRVMTWLRRGFAGTFVALGVKLALAVR